MEVAFGRRVRSGVEFEHLFPKPTGNDKTIKKGASVYDTVGFIQKTVPDIQWQTEKFTKAVITGQSLNEICSQIWHWVYLHIPYKRDEDGVEQVRSPRRVFYDRNRPDVDGKVGVDCDCYSSFISSVLMNLRIPHKYRITKYPQKDGSIPRWQHIYIVVPLDGNLENDLKYRKDYIVLDCVKENYNDEQPYLERKDYNAKGKNMRLDYLDGFDEDEEYQVPRNVDARDLADTYDEEELGKLGQWLKKAASNVGKAVANTAKDVGKAVATAAKAVVKTVAKVFPVTVVLRNAFLLATKVNFMNISKRLRYGYLSDEQGAKLGMNLTALAKVRTIVQKAHNTFKDAGGNPDNLRKAILNGKGNKDGMVPLAGFDGLGYIDGDEDEINILRNDLGEVTLATISTAIPIITALSASLKQVKDLFKPGSKGATEFESESDAQAEAEVSNMTEDSMMSMEDEINKLMANNQLTVPQTTAPTTMMKAAIPQTPAIQQQQPVTPETPAEKPSFFMQATTWVKDNKLLTTGIVLSAVGLAYLAFRNKKENNKQRSSSGTTNGLAGLSTKKRRTKKKNTKKKPRIKSMTIR